MLAADADSPGQVLDAAVSVWRFIRSRRSKYPRTGNGRRGDRKSTDTIRVRLAFVLTNQLAPPVRLLSTDAGKAPQSGPRCAPLVVGSGDAVACESPVEA